MRKLLLLRGPQAVGKSALVARIGLGAHVLSSDSLRLSLASACLNAEGVWGIAQEHNARIWTLFAELAEERMARGETLVLDAMFPSPSEWEPFVERARAHRYDVLMVDLSTVPIERARLQNATRAGYARVSDRVIEATRRAFDQIAPPSSAAMTVERWTQQGDYADLDRRVLAWLRVPVADYSSYARIIHIGDLQGCLTVLTAKGGPLSAGPRDDTRYIFVGDILDRGVENGLLLAWLLPWLTLPNVDLLWGNHEDHLYRYARGDAPVSREFRDRTMPQLDAASIDKREILRALDGAKDILIYRYRGLNVCVNHAGLPGLPPLVDNGESAEPAWHLLSSRQLTHGAGGYSAPVDATFTAAAQELGLANWYQVHGHRNQDELPTWAAAQSFNLEGSVEHGGALRVLVLDDSGFTSQSYPNRVFASWRSRFEAQERADEPGPDIVLPIPDWIRRPDPFGARLSPEMLQALRSHAGVVEKVTPTHPHVAALNFTREVFFERSWDDVVVKARGLFVNQFSGEVVARGYDKFFNLNERPETELAALREHLVFPVSAYVKENGFLGNLGYDAETDSLFIASKSTTSGDFALWFRQIFEASTTEVTRDRIRRYLRDAEASMVFEVLDPTRDPHLIAYSRAKVILLDVFRRSAMTERLSYRDLQKVAAKCGLEAKRHACVFRDFRGFNGWLTNATQDLTYRLAGEDIEGVVIEDQRGFMVKVKLPHYSFWKRMRSAKDRLFRLQTRLQGARSRQAIQAIHDDIERAVARDDHPLATAFLAWCRAQPSDRLGEDILALRAIYHKEVGIAEAALKVRWDPYRSKTDRDEEG